MPPSPKLRPTSAIDLPDTTVAAREAFGIDTDMEVPAFSVRTEHVPDIDTAYRFDRETTLAILRRLRLQPPRDDPGLSRHRQVDPYRAGGRAAELAVHPRQPRQPHQPHRPDRQGRHRPASDGKQVTEFREGILPWALQHACALVFDEYDAGRPDVMFVIQRVLEVEGKLTLLDQNRVIRPHPSFRLFSTANTVGLGDTTGLYHGTQQINQGQMDRWNIVATLNYLPHAQETAIVHGEDGHRSDGQPRRRSASRAWWRWPT